MVKVTDDGIFNEPMEKIWRFVMDENAPHNHAFIKSRKVVEQKGNTVITENVLVNPDGKGTHTERWKLTLNPPKGYNIEYLSGPMAGSKMAQTYTSLGAAKTKASVEGEYKMPGIDDAGIRKSVLSFLEQAFNEDTRNLKQYK